ncbi:MAG: potassium transporter TrkA [Desulfobulbaceae bacterium BRH_c16a]|nr:MAG: potassium transporter TrkA [Desulfobulbaceae bacterium BRH_c16a]
MKYMSSQLMFFFENTTTRKNFVMLWKFVGLLLFVIALFSVLFHLLMLYEGQEHSWVTGVYWTLTVMSTLGFGDITFTTDIGRIFSIIVLGSGLVLLLIMLPFSFIKYFYSPWLEAQAKSRTPRRLPEGISGHVIITNLDPITEKLVAKLKRRHFQYTLIAGDLQRALELYDAGYNVVVGEPDDPATYHRLRILDAALVVATNDDLVNTSIAFTVREITRKVPIVASADNVNSLDILQYSGTTHVFEFAKMLGTAMAERTLGLGRPINIVSSFDKLHIAEIPAIQTTIGGKSLIDIDMRRKTGVMMIGLWEKGRFEVPLANTVIKPGSLLLLAGTMGQLDSFESQYAIPGGACAETPVLILGGGRVGLATAQTLEKHGINYRIIEKKPTLAKGRGENFIEGDAADLQVLERAGLQEVKTVIITTHNDAMNIYLTFYCRQLRPDIQIISRATNERSVSKLHMAGADLVLSYASMGANAVINVLRPDEISMFAEGLNVFTRPVPKSLVGKKLMESGIREKSGCSVIASKISEKLVVGPDPSNRLEAGADLILIGTTESEQKFLDMFI